MNSSCTFLNAVQPLSYSYLLLQLIQLCGQRYHHPHRRLQFVLQHPHLILFAVTVCDYQRHCLHPWKPVQVVVLKGLYIYMNIHEALHSFTVVLEIVWML